jgi:hypothetical protein
VGLYQLDAYCQYEGPRAFVGSFIGYMDHQMTNRDVLPLSAAAPLLPGQTAQISARVVGHAFRPRKMTAVDPEGWIVNALRIGTRSQFNVDTAAVPLSKLIEHALEWDTMQVNQDLVIDIMNQGGSRRAQVAIVRLDGRLYMLRETRCVRLSIDGPDLSREFEAVALAPLIPIPPRLVSVHAIDDRLYIVDESTGDLILETSASGLRFEITGRAAQAAPLVLDEAAGQVT